MALEDTNAVDAVGIETETGNAVLTIADSWDWTDECEHLLALQAKLNAYFEFIETGQVWDAYPLARGRQLVIEVVSRNSPSRAAIELIKDAAAAASCLNVGLRSRIWPETVERKLE